MFQKEKTENCQDQPFYYEYIEFYFPYFFTDAGLENEKNSFLFLKTLQIIFWIRMLLFHRRGKASLRMGENLPASICRICFASEFERIMIS